MVHYYKNGLIWFEIKEVGKLFTCFGENFNSFSPILEGKPLQNFKKVDVEGFMLLV